MIDDFEHFLRVTKENGNNAAVKYIRYLKKVTRIALANKWMDEDPFINKRYTRTQARREALNEDKRIGEVYDFPISIISERTVVDGKESIQNRFVVEGNYKYKFNNGFIAMSDTHAACMNFVNALEKIPGIIDQYEERTAKLKADVPQLEAIVAKMWGKEDELKQLKSALAALDRKITAAIAPKHDEQDGEENRQVNTVEAPTKANDSKKSMVAEPRLTYSCNKKYYL